MIAADAVADRPRVLRQALPADADAELDELDELDAEPAPVLSMEERLHLRCMAEDPVYRELATALDAWKERRATWVTAGLWTGARR